MPLNIRPGSPTCSLLTKSVRDFLADETAATAVEYCLIAAGIALGIFASVAGIEARINAKFTAINSSLR